MDRDGLRPVGYFSVGYFSGLGHCFELLSVLDSFFIRGDPDTPAEEALLGGHNWACLGLPAVDICQHYSQGASGNRRTEHS